MKVYSYTLTLLHSERPKLDRVLAVLSAVELTKLPSQILIVAKFRPNHKAFDV